MIDSSLRMPIWDCPVCARTFHADAGIREPFSKWIYNRIRTNHLIEDRHYCVNTEWVANTHRQAYSLQLGVAYDLANKMRNENSRIKALENLSRVEEEADRRGWWIYKGRTS